MKPLTENDKNTAPTEASNLLADLDIPKILNILWRSIFWIIIIMTASISLAWLYLRYTKPIYESSSSIKLSIKNEKTAQTLQGVLGLATSGVDQNLSGEMAFMFSDVVMREVTRRLNMHISYYTKGTILNYEVYPNAYFKVEEEELWGGCYDKPFYMKTLNAEEYELSYNLPDGKLVKQIEKFGRLVNAFNCRFKLKLLEKYNPIWKNVVYYFVFNNPNAGMEYILTSKNLSIGPADVNAKIIGVSFKDETPAKAQAIVAAIDSVYILKSVEEKSKSNKQQVEFLNEQLRQTTDSLLKYERQLQGFFLENKTKNIDQKQDKSLTEIEKFLKLKEGIANKLAIYQELEGLIAKKDSLKEFIPSVPLLQSEFVGKAIAEYQRVQQDIRKLRIEEIGRTKRAIAYEIEMQNAIKGLTEYIIGAKKLLYKELREINSKFAEIESELLGLPPKGREYARMQRNYDRMEGIYNNILNKLTEMRIVSAGIVPEALILTPANKPTIPIAPRRLIIYLIAGGVGLVLSIGLVAIRYLMHNIVMTEGDVSKITKASILGGIPEYTEEKMDFTRLVVVRKDGDDEKKGSRLSEAIKSIRTNLGFMLPPGKRLLDGETTLLSVTSTISGEGKTFVSTNLAGVIASTGKRVALLDFDMRKPKMHMAFGLENGYGVSNILSGTRTYSECLIQIPEIKEKTLFVITAGTIPPNPSELIERDTFDKLMEDLRKEFDVIMIDTPPVGLVTDGILIMRKVDLPIYVVRAGYSRIPFLYNINRLLYQYEFKNLSVVLNAVKYTKGGYGGYGTYGGYYGVYGDGGYYGEDEGKKKKQNGNTKDKKTFFETLKSVFFFWRKK